MNKIQFPKKVESKTKLVNGGKTVLETIGVNKYKSHKVVEVTPQGVMCNDLEFYSWDRLGA